MPALVAALIRSLIVAGLTGLAERVFETWEATHDEKKAVDAAKGGPTLPSVPAQPPTVGPARDPFIDEWGDDPLVLECRLDRLLKGCN